MCRGRVEKCHLLFYFQSSSVQFGWSCVHCSLRFLFLVVRTGSWCGLCYCNSCALKLDILRCFTARRSYKEWLQTSLPILLTSLMKAAPCFNRCFFFLFRTILCSVRKNPRRSAFSETLSFPHFDVHLLKHLTMSRGTYVALLIKWMIVKRLRALSAHRAGLDTFSPESAEMMINM